MSTDAQTLIGVIEKQERKDSPPDSEREWTQYRFQIEAIDPPGPKRWYGTFDKGWPTNLRTGTRYRFAYEVKQSGEYTNYNLMSAQAVADNATLNVGEFKQPYEPPTDEAKRDVANKPQPEYKSPSRSYDQNQDITRRSIERQIALKAAVELWQQAEMSKSIQIDQAPQAVIWIADAFFAWLREAPSDVRSSPAEPSSEAEGTETSGIDFAKLNAEQKEKREAAREARSQEQPTESDGGPTFFPGEPTDQPLNPPTARKFTSENEYLRALRADFGMTKKSEVETAHEKAGLPKLAQTGNFGDAYATLASHRGHGREA